MAFYKVQIPSIHFHRYTTLALCLQKGVERTHSVIMDLPFRPALLEAQRLFFQQDITGAILQVTLSASGGPDERYEKEVTGPEISLSIPNFSCSVRFLAAETYKTTRLRVFCTLQAPYELQTDLSVYCPESYRFEVFFQSARRLTLRVNDARKIADFSESLAVITEISGRSFCLIARTAAPRIVKDPAFAVAISSAQFCVFSRRRLLDAVFLRLRDEAIDYHLEGAEVVSDSYRSVQFATYPPNLLLYTFPVFSCIDLTEIVLNYTPGRWQIAGYYIQVDFFRKKQIQFYYNVRKRCVDYSHAAVQTDDAGEICEALLFKSVFDIAKNQFSGSQAALSAIENYSQRSYYRPLSTLDSPSADYRLGKARKTVDLAVLAQINQTMSELGETTANMARNMQKLYSFK